ncbi:MAG: hypothetical protein QOF94_3105 [Acidobacteriaceae bacterium]|jgi:hypothetical protein
MLSSVLNSERAVLVNIEIMRAFVRLRQMLASNAELSRRFDERGSSPTPGTPAGQPAWGGTVREGFERVVFDAIRQLMSPPPIFVMSSAGSSKRRM